ncbi:MAG: hydrolase [Bacillota bacterium]|jgi:ADP-ribose pyrophosphatase YjhB (NUDIX family)|nr:hydrolase [Bacillota bacterium]
MSLIDSIKSFNPCCEQERKDKEISLKCIDLFNDVLTRENEIIHITSSGLVLNKDKNKILMIHHNIFNAWSWSGGHADGEENLLLVAINEVNEETGLKNLNLICNNIISLDLLSVIGHERKGKYVAPHLHISIAYLFEANENEGLFIKPDENSGVKWIPINEIDIYSNEPHMVYIYKKILSKINLL